jgi:hypothetical protein
MVPGGKVGIKLKSKDNVIFFRAGTPAKFGATPNIFGNRRALFVVVARQ